MSNDPGQTNDGSTSAQNSHALPLDRFNAFSDGVFAIAITLLALEIKVPHEGVPLLPALREQWPEFLGYYISFAFIGGIWITHSERDEVHEARGHCRFTLNLVLLLFVGLLPFRPRSWSRTSPAPMPARPSSSTA